MAGSIFQSGKKPMNGLFRGDCSLAATSTCARTERQVPIIILYDISFLCLAYLVCLFIMRKNPLDNRVTNRAQINGLISKAFGITNGSCRKNDPSNELTGRYKIFEIGVQKFFVVDSPITSV